VTAPQANRAQRTKGELKNYIAEASHQASYVAYLVGDRVRRGLTLSIRGRPGGQDHTARKAGPQALPPTPLFGKSKAPRTTSARTRRCAGNPILDAAGNPTFAWKLFTPEATLFSDHPDDSKQLITHFFSPNPDEFNADPFTDGHPVRAAWQHSRDTSTVWARTFLKTDAFTPDESAIAWLKLTVVGAQEGPKGGDALTATTFIHRVNTVGGVAPPADTCDSLQDVGSQAFRPYSADYIFYTDQ
jgi:hypothetical protein